jgi:hypothetical protein
MYDMRIPSRIWATSGFVAATAMLIVGGVLVASASSASADIISSGGVLSLEATPGTLSDGSMAPGDTVYWPIAADLNASSSGDLSLKITSSGQLASSASGVRLTLARCDNAWSTDAIPTCDGGAGTVIIPNIAFADISPTRVWNLGSMAAVSRLPMMATISLPSSVPSSLQSTSAAMRFVFTALGDTENASPSDPTPPVLGVTGVDPTGPALLGLGLLLAGLTLGRLRVLARRKSVGVVQ